MPSCTSTRRRRASIRRRSSRARSIVAHSPSNSSSGVPRHRPSVSPRSSTRSRPPSHSSAARSSCSKRRDVQELGSDIEDVAATAPCQLYRRILVERTTELGHVGLHRAGCSLRSGAVPQRIDEAVDRDGPTSVNEQERAVRAVWRHEGRGDPSVRLERRADRTGRTPSFITPSRVSQSYGPRFPSHQGVSRRSNLSRRPIEANGASWIATREGRCRVRCAKYLVRQPLFEDTPRRVLEQIDRLSTEVEFERERVLCRQGETGHEFFVLVRGRVAVLPRRPAAGDTAQRGLVRRGLVPLVPRQAHGNRDRVRPTELSSGSASRSIAPCANSLRRSPPVSKAQVRPASCDAGRRRAQDGSDLT